jgi:Bacterial PH domain
MREVGWTDLTVRTWLRLVDPCLLAGCYKKDRPVGRAPADVLVRAGGRLARVTTEPAQGELVPAPRVPGGPLTIRPRRIRRVCFWLAPAVVVFFVVLGLLLSGSAGEGDAAFGTADRVAMMMLGVFVAAAILLFARPKVVADAHHIKITNVIGGYDLPWNVVRTVRFDRGNPWVSLELQDDDIVAVMAIQAADKEYAVAGVRALRALLAESGDVAGRGDSESGDVAGRGDTESGDVAGRGDWDAQTTS